MSSRLLERPGNTPRLRKASSCSICRSLNLEHDNLNHGFTILVGDLKESASRTAACRSCTLLWEAVCIAVKEETTMPDVLFESILVEHKPPKHPGPMVIHLYPCEVAYGVGEKTFQLYTTEDDSPSPWDLIGRGFHIPTHGLSPSCVALAREWLNACVHAEEKHANCSKVTLSTLPTRVISVGDDTTSPRLVITEGDERAYYAALSHCWGGSTPTMTTSSNIEAYTVSLPADLPKTFMDAIQVARALGIPYIWIDSLCIVQDSPEDWKHEASRMAQVYANAYVTIFADAARDSTSGFLDSPSRKAPERFAVPYKTEPSDSGVIHIRRRGFLAQELPYHTWSSKRYDSGQSMLSTRGWVFQERLLSPRTLHFSHNEMAWECRSVCECECSATSLRTLRTTSVMKHFLHPQDPDVSLAEANWRSEIVPAYTQLDLTFPSDRLPAIQGLADAALRLRSGDQYVSGLWLKTMKADLLWHMDAGDGPSKRINDGGAPTWSWASVMGPVYYNDRTIPEDSKLAILDIITNEGNDPVLLLRGHFVKVEVAYNGLNTVLLGPDDELAAVWDVEGSNEVYKQNCKYFLVFGADDRGPFGLLLDIDTSSHVDKQFRRVGFIPGYNVSRWRRSWGSGGWHEEARRTSVDSSVSETSGGIWEEANRNGAKEWVDEIFRGEATTFRLI